MEQITSILSRQQTRQNWNFFVGETRFKTDFFLRFNNPTISRLYSSWLLQGSLYSIRLWLLTLYLALIMTATGQQAQLHQRNGSFEMGHLISKETEAITTVPTEEESMQHDENQAAATGCSIWIICANLFYFGCFAASMLATYQRSWPLLTKQMIMSILPLLALVRQLSLYHETLPVVTQLNLLARLSLLAPSFITYLLTVESWYKCTLLSCGQLTIAGLIYSFALLSDQKSVATVHFSTYQLLADMIYIFAVYSLVFAMFEKVNKERFVINQTNQQTRKLFGELINSSCASVAVNPKGKINFFNDAFRFFITDRLQYETLPANIYDIFGDQNGEIEHLEELINQMSGEHTMVRKVIEVRIPRNQKLPSDKVKKKKEEEDKKEGEEEKQTAKEKEPNAMRLFEMVRVSCQSCQQSGSKCLILSIESVNDYEGQAQLIVQQAHQLQGFLQGFLDSLELKMLGKNMDEMNKENESKHYQESFTFLAKSVRNPHYLYHCLQQIFFQVKLMSMLSVAQTLWNGRRLEQDFLFGKNIVQCIEQCSSLLSNHAEFVFYHDDHLPEILKGDLDMLMLALQTLTEFALKYSSHDDQIIMRTIFERKTDDENQNLQFEFKYTMLVNAEFDTEKIFALLNVNDPFGLGTTTEDINTFFQQRAITFSSYLEEFGIGLLILPCLVNLLDGQILATTKKVRKLIRTPSTLSRLSSGTGTDCGSEPGRKSQLIVSFKVPMGQSEKESIDDFKLPKLLPEKLSNRTTLANGAITWKSPKVLRLQQDRLITRCASEGEEEDLNMNNTSIQRDICRLQQFNSFSSTPQVPLRQLNSELLIERQNSPAFSESHFVQKSQVQKMPTEIKPLHRWILSHEQKNANFSQEAEKQTFNIAKGQINIRSPMESPSVVSHASNVSSQSSEMLLSSASASSPKKLFSQEVEQFAAISMMNIPAPGQKPSQKMFDIESPFFVKAAEDFSNASDSYPSAIGKSECDSFDDINNNIPSKKVSDCQSPSSRVSEQIINFARSSQQPRAQSSSNRLNAVEAQQNPFQNPLVARISDIFMRGNAERSLSLKNQPNNRPVLNEPVDYQIEEEKKEARPVPVQTIMIDTTRSGQVVNLDQGRNQAPVVKLIDQAAVPPNEAIPEQNFQFIEEEKEDETSGQLGENMPTIYIDELVPGGRDLKHILEDPALRDKVRAAARPEQDDQGGAEQWGTQEEDSDDEDEPELTEEQKRDLQERKRRLMNEYRERLVAMRNEELAKKEEILKRRACANDAPISEEEEQIPLVKLRLDDHIGEEQVAKLQVKGATNQLLSLSNASREQLRQNLPPQLHSPRRGNPDRKLEFEKFDCDQKVREVQRRIWEHEAVIRTQKDRHEQIKPYLVEEVKAKPVIVQPIQEEEKVPQQEQAQIIGIDTFASFDNSSVSNDSQESAPEPGDGHIRNQPQYVLENVEILNLIKIQQLDLSKLEIPADLNVSLQHVQKALKKMQLGRSKSFYLAPDDDRKGPIKKDSNLNVDKEALNQDPEDRKLKKFQSFNAERAKEVQNKNRSSEVDELDICSPGGSDVDLSLSMDTPGSRFVQNQSLVSSHEEEKKRCASPAKMERRHLPDENKQNEFILRKQMNYVSSLSDNIGPIEEEKSQFQSQSSMSEVPMSGRVMSKLSQDSGNDQPSPGQRLAPLKFQSSEDPYSINNAPTPKKKNKASDSESDSSNENVQNQKSGTRKKRREHQSSNNLLNVDRSMVPKKNIIKLNQSVNIEEEKKQIPPLLDEPNSNDASVDGGRIGKIKDLRDRRRMTKVALSRLRNARNRCLLKEKCQKHPVGDSYFQQQEILANDQKASGTVHKWGLANFQRKKQERKSKKPKPEEKKESDDDEGDDLRQGSSYNLFIRYGSGL